MQKRGGKMDLIKLIDKQGWEHALPALLGWEKFSDDKVLSELEKILKANNNSLIDLDSIKDEDGQAYLILYYATKKLNNDTVKKIFKKYGITGVKVGTEYIIYNSLYKLDVSKIDNFETAVIQEIDGHLIFRATIKKDDKSTKYEQVICMLSTVEEVHDPLDDTTTPYIKARVLKGSEIKAVEVFDYEDLPSIVSTPVLKLLNTNPLLSIEFYKTLQTAIHSKSKKTTKSKGLATYHINKKPVLLDAFLPSNLHLCESYPRCEQHLYAEVDENSKKELIYALSHFKAVHNITVISAFIAAHLIHIIKPKVVPLIFLFGDSNVGKTAISSLLSYVDVPQSTTTVHQLLTHISGFRCGVFNIDEKTQWENQLIQELKRGSTNKGLMSRKSGHKSYLSNMIMIASSNPLPSFQIRGLEDLKGLVRRSVFLEVRRELDTLPGIEQYYELLELSKEQLWRAILDELFSFTVDEIINIYNSTSANEKYRLLLTGMELWKRIVGKYGINLNITTDGILKRWEDGEKTALNLKEVELPDLLKSTITETMLQIANQLKRNISDVDELYIDSKVVKATLQTKNYTIDDEKIIFNLKGYKNLSATIKELPNLDNLKDIENYLKSANIQYELKHTRIKNIPGRWIIITTNSLEKQVLKIIEEGETTIEQISEKLNASEDYIEEIIEKLHNRGEIHAERGKIIKL